MKAKFFFFTIIFIFFSCTSKESIQTINKAENLLDTHPDSAFRMLSTIENPQHLAKKYYMQYIALNVLAKYKTYQDIKKDSIVLDAAAYFNKKSDYKYKALSNYAAAALMSEDAKYTGAMEYYKNAEKALENSNYFLLKGLVNENIAYLYDKQFMHNEAIIHYKKALNSYKDFSESKKKQMNVYTWLGSDYLYLKKIDSALVYYNQAYRLSIDLNDTNVQSANLNNIGLIFREKGEIQQAANYFKNAVKLHTTDIEQQYRNIINLASNYLLLNKIDSAGIYVKQIKESLSLIPVFNYQAAATNFLKDFYKIKGDYQKSLDAFEQNKRYHMQLFEENQSKTILEAEKKFDYTVHKAEAEKAKLTQRSYSLIFIGVLLIITIISIILWNSYKKQKLYQQLERQTLRIKQQNQEIENQKLQNELGRFKYMNNAMYKIMEKANALHLEINDIVQAGILHEKSERYRKIQLRLKETQDTIKDNISFNAESFLSERSLLDKKSLEKLTEEEKIILTMLFYKESRKNIASLLSMSQQAVYNRVPRLKNKLISMGVSEYILKTLFEKQEIE